MVSMALILLILALVLVVVDVVLGFSGVGPPSLLTKVAVVLTIIAILAGG